MANRIRCGIFHGVIGFGLLFATPLFAQNAAAPAAATPTPPKVIDANGKFGWPYGNSGVERNINGTWGTITVGPQGFVNNGPQVYYATANCSGTKYLFAISLPTTGFVAGDFTTLQYAGGAHNGQCRSIPKLP
jgi:hypothetical protein